MAKQISIFTKLKPSELLILRDTIQIFEDLSQYKSTDYKDAIQAISEQFLKELSDSIENLNAFLNFDNERKDITDLISITDSYLCSSLFIRWFLYKYPNTEFCSRAERNIFNQSISVFNGVNERIREQFDRFANLYRNKIKDLSEEDKLQYVFDKVREFCNVRVKSEQETEIDLIEQTYDEFYDFDDDFFNADDEEEDD